MQIIQVQTIALILISVVYTILAHVSHKKDAWKAAGAKYDSNSNSNSTANNELAEQALLRQDLAALVEKQEELANFNLFSKDGPANNKVKQEQGGELRKEIRDMKGAIAQDYVEKGVIDRYNTDAINKNGELKTAVETEKLEETFPTDPLEITIELGIFVFKFLKEEVKKAERRLKLEKQRKPRNDTLLKAAEEALEKAKKEFEPEEQNTAVKNLDTALDALRPDGKQMQERSVILVIISVLVLLLDMNGLLFSSEVGDPLQVVVGAMLIVFGINVLINFDKDNKLNLGTIKVLKDLGDNAVKKTETQVAAVFGTIGGILCAVLGAQVLLKSVIKKRLNLKFKKPSFKSLKSKKKNKTK